MRLALILFALAGTAFLVLIFGVAASGGGLSRGVLSEPLNSIVVALTWVALLSLPVLLVGAFASAVVALLRGEARRTRAPSKAPGLGKGGTVSDRNAVVLLVLLGAVGLYFVVFNNRSSEAALALFVVLVGGVIAAIRIARRIRTERRERREPSA